ncbi:MAG: hypothetical protein KAI24_03065 [Planctomycetes bacterium]|nr:hypothetical protein [Planctomycetota bacterium]
MRSTTATRIGVLAGVFVAALAAILLHLWLLMVQDQEVWARRSYENRWAFRSVPSLRGRLLDRHGAVLAEDEPTTRVSVHYLRFRLRHSVGAAVHGATVMKQLQPGFENVRYGYRDGPYGPGQAARDLLATPVRCIEPGVLPKDVTSQLATYATTVLSQVGELSRRQAYRAMREAAQSGRRLGIGDVLEQPRGELLARYDQLLHELRELDQRLRDEQLANAQARGDSAEEFTGLVDRLDELRIASFEKRRITWTDEWGEEHLGSYVEELRAPIADEVSFDLAAAVRVAPRAYAGLAVEPSVRRVASTARRSALDALVGRVNWIDRTIAVQSRLRTLLRGEEPETWVEKYLAERMPANWLEELVPEGLVGDEARLVMIEEARRRYEREMMLRERRGITGFEAWFNDELMGQLGMRFVEHDGGRREHALWSHLRVQSGGDVQVTIDARLQELAEAQVRAAHARYVHDYAGAVDDLGRPLARLVEASLAIVDLHTGDVLAFAGAPVVTDNARHVPGVMWTGNGSIGSVAKPFVLVEHLESIRLGRPHLAPADVEQCIGKYTSPFVNQTLTCGGPHWNGGRDPRTALSSSCNCFFYQVGEGLGKDGVERAFERFGLLPAAEDDAFRLCTQQQVPGVSISSSHIDMRRPLPSHSIGYGVQVSPVFVARAYAGLATGVLPRLGLRLGEPRDGVDLGVAPETLDLVRRGMHDVLTRGTGKSLELLRELGAFGKTGTAERTDDGDNNAWFAGYFGRPSPGGHQLAFCAVVYFVPDEEHGAETAGGMLEDFFDGVRRDPELAWRYLPE